MGKRVQGTTDFLLKLNIRLNKLEIIILQFEQVLQEIIVCKNQNLRAVANKLISLTLILKSIGCRYLYVSSTKYGSYLMITLKFEVKGKILKTKYDAQFYLDSIRLNFHKWSLVKFLDLFNNRFLQIM